MTEIETFVGPEVKENTIRIRVTEPTGYEQDSFRTIRLTSGVQAVIGRKKGEKTTSIQSLVFDKEKYTLEQAESWYKKHSAQFDEAMAYENKKYALFEGEASSEEFASKIVRSNPILVHVKNKDDFDPGSFRMLKLRKGVVAAVGKEKGKTEDSIQSLIFDRKRYNLIKAKRWYLQHQPKFSQALELDKQIESIFNEEDHSECSPKEHLMDALESLNTPEMTPEDVSYHIKMAMDCQNNHDYTPSQEEYSMMQKVQDINETLKNIDKI